MSFDVTSYGFSASMMRVNSFCRRLQSCERTSAMSTTKSTSCAPAFIASRDSAILHFVPPAPRGKSITVHTFVFVPASIFAASGTYTGLMHTEAKPYEEASPMNARTFSSEAVGERSVWSIIDAIFLAVSCILFPRTIQFEQYTRFHHVWHTGPIKNAFPLPSVILRFTLENSPPIWYF